MEYLGGVSGATLGYITAGVPGAIFGYKKGYRAGKKLTKNYMVPISRKRRGSTTSFTSRGSSSKRRLSNASTGPAKGKYRVSRYAVKSTRVAATGDSRAVMVKRKGKAKFKRVKKVKITKNFKKKVESALSSKAVVGHFRETHYGAIDTNTAARYYDYGIDSPAPAPLHIGKQWLYGRTINDNWNFENFTFREIIDATRVLFMNKISRMTIQNYEKRHKDQLTFGNEMESGILFSKWKVRSCDVTYHIRNNTPRQWVFEMFRCTPKQKTWKLDEHSALAEWFVAISNQENQDSFGSVTAFNPNLNYIGVMGQNDQIGTPDCVNRSGVNPNTLGVHPKMSPTMRARWNITSTVMKLEPGQEHTFVHHGPKNFDMDPQTWKMKQTNDLNNDNLNYAYMKPGISESCFFRVIPELLPASGGTAAYSSGRYGDSTLTNDTTRNISVEAIKTFVIEMPEVTGTQLTLPAVPANAIVAVESKNRKPVYYYNVWNSAVPPAAAFTQRFDEENPVVPVTLD